MSTSPRVRLVLALASVYVIWGSTYWALARMIRTIPPFLGSGLRFLSAGMILTVLMRARGAPWPTRREWRGAALVGVLLVSLGNGLVSWAEQWVPSSLAAIVVSTMPLWAAVVSALWGEPIARREAVGIALGFGGVVWMNAGGELWASGPMALVLLLSPVAWAAGSIAARRVALPAGPMATAAEMLVGGAALVLVGLGSGERISAVPSASSLVAWAYLVVFGSLIGLTAYGWLLRNARPAVATSYAYVNPLIAVALGLGLAGETLHRETLAGGALVLAAVVALSQAHRRQRNPARRVLDPNLGTSRLRRIQPGSVAPSSARARVG